MSARTTPGFRAFNPETDFTSLIGALRKANVGIKGDAPEQPGILTQLLLQLAAPLLLILVFVYMLRQMQGAAGGRGAMSFGKSKARLLGEDQVNVTFADVAGVDEAKTEVGEIVDFLKDPGKFQKLGGKIPKGVLMVGRPAPARRCWHAPSPARPRCRSSRFPVPTSSRCSSVSAPARARHVRAGQEARALHHLHR